VVDILVGLERSVLIVDDSTWVPGVYVYVYWTFRAVGLRDSRFQSHEALPGISHSIANLECWAASSESRALSRYKVRPVNYPAMTESRRASRLQECCSLLPCDFDTCANFQQDHLQSVFRTDAVTSQTMAIFKPTLFPCPSQSRRRRPYLARTAPRCQ
jgi:hypothetical protein